MDTTTGSALGIAGCVTGVLAALYTYYKHSHCKSKCCGKEVDLQLDLTPVATAPTLKAIETKSEPPV
jgi:hypothetical protein